jgi:hypothetical protein
MELIGAKISEICSGVLAIEENLGRVPDEVTEARFASWTLKARDGRIVEMLAAYRTLSLAAGDRATIIFLIDETLRYRMNLRDGNNLGAGEWI